MKQLVQDDQLILSGKYKKYNNAKHMLTSININKQSVQQTMSGF